VIDKIMNYKGSIPPRSTTLKVDESQQKQAIATGNSDCGFFRSDTQLVSDSPKWATEWHDFDTFLPSSENNIGTRECYSYRKKIFKRHPYLENGLKSEYLRIYREKSLREANLFIGRIDKKLMLNDFNLSSSSSKVKDFCENASQKCRLIIVEYGENETAYNICRSFAFRYTLEIPTFDKDEPFVPTLNRLSCSSWWYTNINKIRLQHVEQAKRNLNLVHKHASCYSSQFAVENRNTQLKNSYDYLSSSKIVNDEGQSYSLLDIYNKSVANPFNRKAELMTRIRGFEEVASQMGHVGEFYTITCPSKMHAVLSSGKPNPKYNDTTPKEVHEYFKSIWSLIRSAIHKKGIRPYGFRVVEPHHDGTPHWHLLLFMHPNDVNTSRSILSKYSLKEDGNERGAKAHRFKAVSIDPKKGSAAGYIAKYISKNIDGSDISKDLYGNDAKHAASNIDAWSATWDIRQFQQIGGPSVTVWRELRQLKESSQPEVVQAFIAADAGDWAAFVMAMGGPMLPRRNRPIHPYYESNANEVIDTETGEVTQSNLTRYGDIKAPTLKGLINKNVINLTRTRIWKKITEPMPTFVPKNESRNKELVELHPIPI
jgi:hypothetical protein